MIRNPKDLPRFTPQERANHWIVAISFVLLALSGLSFFHPAFVPLNQLFGGGTWARILHPYIGVFMALFFLFMYFRFRGLNKRTKEDREWMSRLGDVMGGREENLPEQGKFNAGQKMVFRWSVISMIFLVISGLMIWQAWFSVSAEWRRVAVVVHALFAFIMIATIMVHIYAAIWVKGSIRAMTAGTVSRGWARQHHRAWYREMTGK